MNLDYAKDRHSSVVKIATDLPGKIFSREQYKLVHKQNMQLIYLFHVWSLFLSHREINGKTLTYESNFKICVLKSLCIANGAMSCLY